MGFGFLVCFLRQRITRRAAQLKSGLARQIMREAIALAWLSPGRGYGFPVPQSIRDLLVGDDSNFL
ncbi:MAG: hypothetical protein WAL14_05270 [Pseudolabrys sp.]